MAILAPQQEDGWVGLALILCGVVVSLVNNHSNESSSGSATQAKQQQQQQSVNESETVARKQRFRQLVDHWNSLAAREQNGLTEDCHDVHSSPASVTAVQSLHVETPRLLSCGSAGADCLRSPRRASLRSPIVAATATTRAKRPRFQLAWFWQGSTSASTSPRTSATDSPTSLSPARRRRLGHAWLSRARSRSRAVSTDSVHDDGFVVVPPESRCAMRCS